MIFQFWCAALMLIGLIRRTESQARGIYFFQCFSLIVAALLFLSLAQSEFRLCCTKESDILLGLTCDTFKLKLIKLI